MRRALVFAAFFLVAGLLVAAHVRDALAPAHAPLHAFDMPHGWIATPAAAVRGYFRHRLEIAFEPRHAWIALAAEDYRLYVNGALVGANRYVLRAGTPFQEGLSAHAQRLSADEAFPRGGGAQSLKAPKREWRMVHFHDLTPYLKRGRNTLALFVQSAERNRAAVYGGVAGEGVELEIPGLAHLWRSSTEATSTNGVRWFEPQAEDFAWEPAVAHAAPQPLQTYASANPDIWRSRFEHAAIGRAVASEEHVFALELPRKARANHAWLRVWSSAAYELFLDEHWVGQGAGGAVDAYDLSPLLAREPRRLSLRVHPASPQAAWISVDGRIGEQVISTATGWRSLAEFHPDWLRGEGRWVEAPAHERSAAPGPILYQRAEHRSWERTGVFLFYAVVAALLLAAAARALGFWLLAPALFGILAVQALRWRFSESDSLLMFIAPGVAPLWLATGPLILIATLVALSAPIKQALENLRSSFPRKREPMLPNGNAGPPPSRGRLFQTFLDLKAVQVPPAIWLAAICLLALVLRWIGLEHQSPSGDDYTSWEAARGILREGVPRAASGILYTRSPLFHYALAGWMSIFGEGLASVRGFSLLPGVGVVAASYFLVRAIARHPLPALLTALALAVDPWLLGITNLIRFYQLMQFFAVLSVLYFLKGFVWREGGAAQALFFVFTTAAVLSQEIYAVSLAAFLLVFLLCYRPFEWPRDRGVLLGLLAMTFVIWVDLRVFANISLTPHVVLSSRSEPLLAPHLTDAFGGGVSVLTQLATDFFWLRNGDNALWSLLFFAGLAHWVRKPDPAMLTLYAIVLVTIPLLSVLVVPVNPRYAYGLYPLFIAAAVMSAWAAVRDFPRPIARFAAGILAATLVLGAELDKLAAGYAAQREIDYRRAWEHVAAHRQSLDKIMAVRTPGAGVVFGGADYYMMVSPAFDGLYQRADAVVDRWSGGKVVWKVDQLREALLQHERVWVIVDDPRLPNLPHDYAAFVASCCEVKAEFFGGQVLLWERAAGRYYTAADYGGAADTF